MLQWQEVFKFWSLNTILGDPEFWGKIEIETYIIQSNKSKDWNIIVQNLSGRIFF